MKSFLLIIPLLFVVFVGFNWINAQMQVKPSVTSPETGVGTLECSSQKSEPKMIPNMPYKGANGSELWVDVYIPPGTCLPAVLLIHGGGFIAGDKKEFEIVAKKLMEKGFVVVNANYTLAKVNDSKTTYPVAVKDLQNVVTLMRQNADNFNINSNKIAAMGASSGANLALMLGTTGKKGADKVDAVISWSGPLNLELMNKNSSQEKSENRIKVISQYIGCSYDVCPDKWQDASPTLQIDKSTVPVFIVNSISEGDKPMGMPITQLEDTELRLRNEGISYIAKKVPGDAHAFFPQLLEETVDFLKNELGL